MKIPVVDVKVGADLAAVVVVAGDVFRQIVVDGVERQPEGAAPEDGVVERRTAPARPQDDLVAAGPAAFYKFNELMTRRADLRIGVGAQRSVKSTAYTMAMLLFIVV